MSNCKWMKDEICVNADCPMRADYCPVADNEGVCRFEDRTESKAMTDKERLVELLSDIDRHLVILGRSCNIGNPFGIIADHLIANGVVVQKQGNWSLRYESVCDFHTGEWNEEFYLECSECKRKIFDISDCLALSGEWDKLIEPFPYCNCGAKMVKEGD